MKYSLRPTATLRLRARRVAAAVRSTVFGLCVAAVAIPGRGETPAVAPLSPGEVPAMRLTSGRAVGDVVPQFYTRAVTGPFMNRSVCYVCRNGERPVVMVLLRDLNPETRRLVRNVDRIVDRHRGDGLRGFGVFLSDETRWAVSRVQTFAFEGRITTPLTVGGESVGYDDCQAVHDEAAVTVVLYKGRRVVSTLALHRDELDVPHLQHVLGEVLRFAEHHAPVTDAPDLAVTDLVPAMPGD